MSMQKILEYEFNLGLDSDQTLLKNLTKFFGENRPFLYYDVCFALLRFFKFFYVYECTATSISLQYFFFSAISKMSSSKISTGFA